MPRGNGGIIGPVNTSFSGVWSLTEAQLRRSANTWPNFYAALLSESATGSDVFSGADAADPYFEYTTLLLPGNGTNGAQNNTFLDGSTNNFTITRNGNTTQGTFSPFSQTGWGNYFTGNQSIYASNAAFAVGTGAFTVELFYNPSIWAGTNQRIFVIGQSGTDGVTIQRSSGSNVVEINISASGVTNVISYTWTPNIGQWYYIALVRSGTGTNQTALYIDGVSVATGTSTASIGSTQLSVGGINWVANYGTQGYISNVRFSNVARTITVPTAPYTSDANTLLLTCQSNRFVDNSQTPKTLTIQNAPTVVPFSPFNPTASWSAATYGGSGYFDGSGDYISAPTSAANFGASNFTIETWVWFTTNSAGYQPILTNTGSADYQGWIMITETTNVLSWLGSTNGSSWTHSINTGIIPTINCWTHIALVRNGNTITYYVNGVSAGTSSIGTSSLHAPSNAFYTGYYPYFPGGARAFNGYFSGVRLINGVALYTTNFTPPTAPVTATTNTSLLLNFTNAGIYDATSKNDLETVGNAQISTTQSKWGGSSISFDGTGDWLLIPDRPPQRIGTGNFTVEMWVYRNSSGTYGLAGKGTGTTGWLVSLNSSNQVVFTYGSSTITSSGTVSATTWTHIAVVREGTSTNQTKIYISGTNDGTGTVSTDFNQTNSMYIGANRTGGSAANAYVQDVRITNYARYTSNFTAPTAAFPTL